MTNDQHTGGTEHETRPRIRWWCVECGVLVVVLGKRYPDEKECPACGVGPYNELGATWVRYD